MIGLFSFWKGMIEKSFLNKELKEKFQFLN
jgi:hypothetical protein